jgi:hypothetical protein
MAYDETVGDTSINPIIKTEPGEFRGDTYSRVESSGGFTKREFFAYGAMKAILSNPTYNSNHLFGCNGTNDYGYQDASQVSDEAIRQADALIYALNKK